MVQNNFAVSHFLQDTTRIDRLKENTFGSFSGKLHNVMHSLDSFHTIHCNTE